jgi:TM2 domain-containing membrane protein YozV
MKNKIVAALLALFLGGLGFHRFYLGQIGLGILHLVFCWTFIPAFVGFVDGIVLLVMSEDKFNAKYNQGNTVSSAGVNTADELEKLHSLKEKGIISDKDYNTRKAKLL